MEAGDVSVKITGDASSLESSFLAAGTAAVAFGDLISELAQRAASAALDVVRFPMEAAKAAGRAAEQFDQLSQRTGIAVQSLQGLQVAMAREGIEASSLAQGFRTLSGQMIGVKEGTAKSTELFRQLGISTSVVTQGTGALMSAIADKFSKMADGAEKSRFAVELFGRSGLQLIPILNQGSAGLTAAMQKASEFGLILTEVQQHDLKVFDDSLDDLDSALKGFTAQVGAAFAPALTSMIHLMTDAVVFAKDVFNAFADAGEKLTIRLGAAVAAIQLIGRQLMSFSIFSMEAWKATMDQVKAIDEWAAKSIRAVDANREQTKSLGDLAKAHLNAAQAIQSHIDHQKILGEQAVSFTTIKLKEQAEISKKIFKEIMDAEEQALNSQLLQGPEKNQETGRITLLRKEAILSQANFELQKAFYAQAPAMIGAATAARQAGIESLEDERNLQADLIKDAVEDERIKDAKILALDAETDAKRMGLIRQFPTFFEQQMQNVVSSNNFSVGLIINTWTSGLANSLVNGGNFIKAAWKSTQVAIIQGGLNTVVQWGAQQALMVSQTAGTAAATTSIWAGASTAIEGFFAATSTAFTAMVADMVEVIVAVGTFIEEVLTAIAEALTATVFGIPWAGAILVGIGLIAAALAATGTLGFKEGGVGDFGSGTPAMLHGKEAIIPLDKWDGMKGGNQTIILIQDGRETTRTVLKNMPREVRFRLGNAF